MTRGGAVPDDDHPPPYVVVAGASAGGVEALAAFVSGLPPDLPAAVAVVLHLPFDSHSVLPQILDRRGPLPAMHAENGQPLEPGHVYVAPPDHHLLLLYGTVALSRGPRENGHRPAVDVLFRSAALTYGPRAIGVVLSGTLDDGAGGLASVVGRGGRAFVQSPEQALFPSMPLHALEQAPTAWAAAAEDLGALIADICRETSPPPSPPDELLDREVSMSELDPKELAEPERPGTPAGITCPDCGGSLFTLDDTATPRFRCRVGHAWAAHSLLAQQSLSLESALWLALRTLEDRAALSNRMMHRTEDLGNHRAARRYGETERESHAAADEIRRLLQSTVPEREEGA